MCLCVWESVFAPPILGLHDYSGFIRTGVVKYVKIVGEFVCWGNCMWELHSTDIGLALLHKMISAE